MAIEALSADVQEELAKELKDNENTFKGCCINVANDQVHVKIPIKGTPDFNTFIFSKRDVKRLFESLYSS